MVKWFCAGFGVWEGGGEKKKVKKRGEKFGGFFLPRIAMRESAPRQCEATEEEEQKRSEPERRRER